MSEDDKSTLTHEAYISGTDLENQRSRSTSPMKTFNDWWYELIRSKKYRHPEPGASEEELAALEAKKEECRVIFEAGREEGMKVVPEIKRANLRLTPFTDTLLKVYEERDHLLEQTQELTKALREAKKINDRFHKLLSVVKEFDEYWERPIT